LIRQYIKIEIIVETKVLISIAGILLLRYTVTPDVMDIKIIMHRKRPSFSMGFIKGEKKFTFMRFLNFSANIRNFHKKT